MAVINQASKEDIQNIISGDTPAGKAVEATHAASADTAASATSATSAQTAQSAQTATTASSATKATQDGQGRVIADTYSLLPVFEEHTVQSSAWTALEGQGSYTYQASIVITTAFAEDAVLQLFNTDRELFAEFGFQVAAASGQTITVWSAGQPQQAVTFRFAVYNY